MTDTSDAPVHHVATHTSHLVASTILLFIVTLNVSAQPSYITRSTDGATPAAIAPGSPEGSYALSGFENINLFSQSLSFHLPLLKIGGRGSAGYTIMLPIERKWRIDNNVYDPSLGCERCDTQVGVEQFYTPNGDWYTPLKPGFSPGVMVIRHAGSDPHPACGGTRYAKMLTRLAFVMPDGTEYEFRDTNHQGAPKSPVSCYEGATRGTIFVTADGTSATFVSSTVIKDNIIVHQDTEESIYPISGVLTLRDGTRYQINNNQVEEIRDAQGNVVTYQNGVITDSLGRQVTVGSNAINFKGFEGTNRTIQIIRKPLDQALRAANNEHGAESPKTYSQLFPSVQISVEDQAFFNSYFYAEVVSAVILPDDSKYYFFYNSYGELARVVLPTGGAFEYDYQENDGIIQRGVDQSGPQSYDVLRRVVRRRVYDAGGAVESVTTYGSCEGLPEPVSSTCVQVDQLDPKNNHQRLTRTRHYFHGSPGPGLFRQAIHYSHYLEGREFKTEFVSADGVTVLRREEQNWQQRAPVGWWINAQDVLFGPEPPNDTRLADTTTTLLDTTPTLVSKKEFQYDDYNNQTEVKEYGYGSNSPGALLRRTVTNYLTTAIIDGTPYNYATDPSIHQRSLVKGTSVFDYDPQTGQERLAAASENIYDESAYAPLPCDTTVGRYALSAAASVARGRPTTIRQWLDTPGNGTGGYVEQHVQYDQCGNPRKSWDAHLSAAANHGNMSEIRYAPDYFFAFPTETTSPPPDSDPTYVSTSPLKTFTTYDLDSGLVTSTTDANGKISRYKYRDDNNIADPLNRLRKTEFPDGGWTKYTYGISLNNGVSNLYVNTTGRLDETRTTNQYQFYDGLGRPNRSFIHDGVKFLTTDKQYDALGRVRRISNPYSTDGSHASGNPSEIWTTTVYDSLGRVLTVTTPDDPNRASPANDAKVINAYRGNKVMVTDQAGKSRMSETDALGRLVRVVEYGRTLSDRYVVAEQDGILDLLTVYVYDALGNLRRVEQDTPSGVASPVQQRRYFMYDSLSRLVRVKNPEEQVNPALHKEDSVAKNADWSILYNYDPRGNLVSRTDARDVTTTYTYDALNRATTVTYTNDPAATPTVKHYYDGALNGIGRAWRSEVTGRSLTEVNRYDALGRVLEQQQRFFANNTWSLPYIVQRSYSVGGQVVSQTYPSGRTVAYTYDGAGRLSGFTGNIGDGVARTYSSAIIYDESSRITREQFGTQTPLYHKQRFNVRGQLWNVRLSSVGDDENWNRGMLVNHYGSGDWSAWGTSGADNNGNLQRSHYYVPTDDATSGWSLHYQDYSYDTMNRLTSVTETQGANTGGWAQAYRQVYDYDRWGNRAINEAQTSGNGVPETQFTIDRSMNRLGVPAVHNKTLAYDTAGNLTFDNYTGNGSRVYDAENRMTAAQDAQQQWAYYTYDANGQRVRRSIAGEETWQVYGIGGELLAEYRAGTAPFAPTREYGYRNGELLVTIANGDDLRLKRFVQNLYVGAFRRDATAAELQQHTSALAAAGAQGQSALLAKASEIARNLFTQTNYDTAPMRTDAQYVTDLYYAYTQRAPDSSGLAWWTAQAACPANSTCAPSQQRALVCNGFEQSGEFITLVNTLWGVSTGDNERVEHYIKNFYLGAYGREPNASELQQQTARLNTAAAQGQSAVVAEAEQMGRELFSSQVTDQTISDTQYIINLYEGFLQRGPDQGGLNHWPAQAAQSRQYVLGYFATYSATRELAATLYREVDWLVADHLGTPRMVVHKSGALAGVRRHDYLPFGEEIVAGTGGRTVQTGYSNSDTVRQKFTGYERDAETNLDYAQARYYASSQGRFASLDPLAASARLATPQSWNRYPYVLNNPVRFVDPSGLIDTERHEQSHANTQPQVRQESDLDAQTRAQFPVFTNATDQTAVSQSITDATNAVSTQNGFNAFAAILSNALRNAGDTTTPEAGNESSECDGRDFNRPRCKRKRNLGYCRAKCL